VCGGFFFLERLAERVTSVAHARRAPQCCLACVRRLEASCFVCCKRSSQKKGQLLMFLLLIMAAALAQTATLAPGVLDASFGSGGSALLSGSVSIDVATRLLV
jgi:hypothetical protein